MEVPGQKLSTDKDAKLCCLCEDFDITTYADGFCVECEVYFCNSCFVKHKGRKISRNHSLVTVDESKSVKVTVGDTYDLCQEHSGEIVKYYCPKHDQVGCGECIIVCHNGCKLELIRNKAADYDNNQEFRNLTEEMNKYMKEAENSLSLVAINRQQLAESYEQFVCDVEAFTNQVFERINIMRQKILSQAKNVMLNDKMKIDDVQKDTDDLIADLTRKNNLLESKCDTPNKLFVSCLLIKPELKRTQHNLDCLRTKNVVTQYKFMQDKILAESITENKVIGMLIEQSSERSRQHQHEFKQTDSADKGQVRNPSPQHAQSEMRYKQFENEVAETYTTEDTMKAIAPKKRQPLHDRTLVCNNLKMDGICLSYTAVGRNDIGLYVFKEIACAGTFFEIEILNMGKSGSLAIGLVPDGYPDNLLPGLGQNSYGYHSDGKVYTGSKYVEKRGDAWKVGDRITCIFAVDKFRQWGDVILRVVFENNGKRVDGVDLNSTKNYHFAVGMTSLSDRIKVVSIPAK